jgi:hypothetical protein
LVQVGKIVGFTHNVELQYTAGNSNCRNASNSREQIAGGLLAARAGKRAIAGTPANAGSSASAGTPVTCFRDAMTIAACLPETKKPKVQPQRHAMATAITLKLSGRAAETQVKVGTPTTAGISTTAGSTTSAEQKDQRGCKYDNSCKESCKYHDKIRYNVE